MCVMTSALPQWKFDLLGHGTATIDKCWLSPHRFLHTCLPAYPMHVKDINIIQLKLFTLRDCVSLLK